MFKKILAVLLMCFTALAMAAVDVNKASEAELDSVKGIGPGTSKQILTERKKGEFKSWEDFISRVKGVGDKRAANLSEAGLTVGGKAFKPAATTKTDAKGSDKKSDDKKAKSDKKDEKSAAAPKSDKKDEKSAAAPKSDKKDEKAAAPAAPAAAAKPAASAAKK